ncbi:MAG: RNA methyltransferase [Hyphomicrobiaceae bacterium]|nr:RNA methyltransferase [Hyphomicrobiaceae bacterium]
MERAALDASLRYCAEQSCRVAGAFCSECRLARLNAGLRRLDDYCRQFSEITFRESPLVVTGGAGGQPLEAASLAELAESWEGREIWYLARRVIRRLRHKQDRDGKLGARPETTAEPPAVVLVKPQMAENIGMVARAMANFGLDELRLVTPRDGWPNAKAEAAASGAHVIIDEAAAFADTPAAVGDLNWICATTARPRDLTKPVLSPQEAAHELVRRAAAGERVGVLFGPERSGLDNDDIALADALVIAPVNPAFASLNLAQAVLLVGYEWYKEAGANALGRGTATDPAAQPGLNLRAQRPATKEELLGLFEHLERELDAAGYLFPPDKRPSMVRNLRTLLSRFGATEQEVRSLRGIVAALAEGRRKRPQAP